MTLHRLEIEARSGLGDPLAEATRRRLDTWLQLRPRALATRRVYHLELGLDADEAAQVLAALVDPVAEVGALGMLADPVHEGEPAWVLSIGSLPGVTDAVGSSVARAAADCVGRPLRGNVYTSTLYLFWGLEREAIERAAKQLLYNPLIQRMKLELAPRALDLSVPRAGSAAAPEVHIVPLRAADDAALETISRDGMLALSLTEMRAIQAHFAQLGRDPTDAELECLAQTWSEHCKHKIFASPIHYTDPSGVGRVLERGLFRGYVRAATETVAAQRLARSLDPAGENFLVSVFHDNAGVVRFTEADHLVYKVETHNSPSALDPYGGAMTGIVGVNRDSFGTGLGADLLTNVWGYCFGDPRGDHSELPAGLMHPRRIRDGVHLGVIDGGNQSGIPYSRGFELFDPRYTGKPLVYCGTVAAMPVAVPGPDGAARPTHEKPIAVGDNIVMVGGRIGKDGIHGATFSSVELDEQSPVQAVQIGDPITQKMMWDFLTEARDRGLFSGMTDNGAGGLSSSVGELAEATGGARIDLAAAPLKYPGLAPWEILISEAQERMTVAVPPSELEAFLELAQRREVEASVLGVFTDAGRFEVTYAGTSVCDLGLAFLHEGVPLPTLEARWSPPTPSVASPAAARAQLEALDSAGLGAAILDLVARPNLAANDDRARHYDHEVKGLSVIKPLLGIRGDVPATATVMRVRHGRDEGVVLGEGIHPWYADIDTDAMARACVDEGVRRVLCAGARPDRIAALDNFCWPDPIRSAKTPDGEHKLAQLVRCCEGLHDACVAYGVPLISGKDSMKNDAFLGGVKISIPPTLLVSVIGQTTDVAQSLSLEPRGSDDRVYLLGPTALELDGSEYARACADRGAPLAATDVPRTDLERCWARYQAFVEQRDAGRVRSAHVCGRGGLALALVHMLLAGERSLELSLDALVDAQQLPLAAALLSESTGRIVFTSAAAHAPALEQALGPHGLVALGQLSSAGPPALRIQHGGGGSALELSLASLRARFEEGLHGI
ncbi:Phosphoribosylformylglycinamidine synthase, PurS subunit [Enhygromyxa salina]|uniref:Phosphoribosylformylglycinamidine synthase subunit PurL n=1 Tax=Enhygromyxa salina TaxID=215803 RepID=A0A0C1Z3U2_9BACT|nr:AIR synthase-related protein [Enhygromyxa salina]KIG12324.1 Phosphoribosylformylglycinamidine synthase, PurS subunit [Enhygromyxa salina]